MARNAVILSVTVILSLFLLSHSRLDSSAAVIPKVEIAASTPSWDPQAAVEKEEEKEKSNSITVETMTVDLRRPVHLNADQIAHSFRLPNGGHRHAARPLRPVVEISYGNDMIELQKKDGKKEKERRRHHDDSDSDDEDVDEEMEQQKKMRKRLRKTMKKKHKMERERENNGGFVNWISRFFNRF